MMPKLSFKPDSSFFRKIAIGAVGARAVAKRTSHGMGTKWTWNAARPSSGKM